MLRKFVRLTAHNFPSKSENKEFYSNFIQNVEHKEYKNNIKPPLLQEWQIPNFFMVP